MFFCVAIFALNLGLVKTQYVSDRRPEVLLKQGSIVGIKEFDDTGRAVDAYLGVPYASPPVNNLRFGPPKKHAGWNGSWDASNYRSQCPQVSISSNEDCLYLNIWTPENAIRSGPKPVVIVFEGIEFQSTNGAPTPGQELAGEDLILVSVNYRLNIFGFLCLGIPEARGNLGLLDQYFAILWVKENIRYFGGDPNKITLLGHSAGAASVILHMTSPRTTGLFHRIIISSGSALSPWHMSNNPFAASKKVAQSLGCFHRDPKVVLNCLQGKSTKDVLNAYEEYTKSENIDLFLPVVDKFLPNNDKYLPNDPEKALREDAKQQVPILIGISEKISDPKMVKWKELSTQGFSKLEEYMEYTMIPEIIKRYNFDSHKKWEVSVLIKWMYLHSSQNDVALLLKQLNDLDFEARIEAPLFSLLSVLQTSYIGPLYVYHLDDMNLQVNASNSYITSDQVMLFGPVVLQQFGRRRFTAKESRISHQFKQCVKNFILFGDPTPRRDGNWKRYTSNEYYIETFSANPTDEVLTRNRRISFWTQLLPKIAQDNNAVYNMNPNALLTTDSSRSIRHAMFTLLGLVIALLVLLTICIVLLRKRYKEREGHLGMGY